MTLLLLISCSGDRSVTEKQEDIVTLVCQPDLEGAFMGAALGESYTEVRKKICQKPIADAESVLECHRDIFWKGENNKLVAYYTFDSFGLFEIQADLFLPDEGKTDSAFNGFRAHFDSLYGENQCVGQHCRWTTFSRSNNLVEVTLSKESFDMDHPFLSINFLEPINDEI
jgi:hypothetical protein